MRLIALYNVFDAEELLEGSIACIRPHVDFVLATVQTISNHGERYEDGARTCADLKRRGLIDEIAMYQPISLPPYRNETRKRLLSAEFGRGKGFTHFIHLDCDEYYVPEQFVAAQRYVIDQNADGSVAAIKTYFRQPDWALEGLDDYFVPFIHRYGSEVKAAEDGKYPFRCDQTRITEAEHVILIPPDLLVMHHFSWVRKDIERKTRNHSQSGFIRESGLMQDYRDARPGHLVKHYARRIEVAPKLFDISI